MPSPTLTIHLPARTAALAASLLLSACAAHTSPCASPQAASSLACLQARAREPVMRACLDDLFDQRSMSARRRSEVAALYRYPATNADTYFSLRQMGAVVPSPHEWCEDFAARRTALTMGSAR